MELDAEPPNEWRPDLGRWPGIAGVASLAFLAASVRWAHHFGVATNLLIVAWASTTLVALATSLVGRRTSRDSRRAARIGLALSLVSVAALVLAGAAFALGDDPTGACGGG